MVVAAAALLPLMVSRSSRLMRALLMVARLYTAQLPVAPQDLLQVVVVAMDHSVLPLDHLEQELVMDHQFLELLGRSPIMAELESLD